MLKSHYPFIKPSFKASEDLKNLHQEIHTMSSSLGINLLNEISKKNPSVWITHITLGNIHKMKRNNIDVVADVTTSFLSAGMESMDSAMIVESDENVQKSFVACVTMGGPVPDQLELDWNFEI